MPRILLSYRRSDSQAMAGRVFDWLVRHYGEEQVFIDIDDIPLGTDFRAYIRMHLTAADLVLAVIGPRWLGPREGQASRIFDEDDPVAIEIATALAESVPLIPVLVDGAKMPSRMELPESLAAFASINAATVDVGRDFRTHMDRLRRAIDEIAAARAKPGIFGKLGGGRAVYAGLAALLLIAGGVGFWAMWHAPKAEPPVARVEPAPKQETPPAPVARVEPPPVTPASPPVVASPPPAAVPVPAADPPVATPAPAAPPVDEAKLKELAKRDDDVFARAVRQPGAAGYTACTDYLRAFADGRHVAQCKAIMLAYDEQFWDGIHASPARRRRGTIDTVVRPTISIQNYERYLKALPDGRHAAEARAAIEDIRVFEAARRTNTEAALDAYLAAYPNGLRAEDARNLLPAARARDRVVTERKAAACNTFARNALSYAELNAKDQCGLTGPRWVAEQQPHFDWCMSVTPDESRRDGLDRKAAVDACTSPRREREAWERAQALQTLEGFRGYLAAWPNGPNAANATGRLAQLCNARWPESKRLSTWKELTLFAAAECRETQFSRDAVALRENMDEAAWTTAKTADTRKAYEDYIAATGGDPAIESRPYADNKTVEFREAGGGRHAAEVAAIVGDFVIWEDTDAIGSAAAYDAYVRQNPRGRFVATAQQRRAGLGEKLRTAWANAEQNKLLGDYEAYLRVAGCELRPFPFYQDPDECKNETIVTARQRIADLDAFAEAEKANDASSYFEYLARFPKGLKAAVAKQRCHCMPR